ncbi:hypothetical protein K0M31_016697 [Melipona bicolor]|uniref:Uncharacterized protein n=1 Tax=Melipona bicolor TaxID=60889 RepID=A0AA40KEP3_9HYME|nr:hypothetical protein K0M31_016697 [Melipona bicolor]
MSSAKTSSSIGKMAAKSNSDREKSKTGAKRKAKNSEEAISPGNSRKKKPTESASTEELLTLPSKPGTDKNEITKRKSTPNNTRYLEDSSDSDSETDFENPSSGSDMEFDVSSFVKTQNIRETESSIEKINFEQLFDNSETDEQKRKNLHRLEKVSESITQKEYDNLTQKDFRVIKY